MDSRLSIIIPVYNNENYLRSALQSVLAQTYPDFEVLVVDDGSTDGSRAICQEFAQKDKRLRIIHKENGGVSSARNRGIEEAVGQYIAFVDGDDCIDPEMYTTMITILQYTGADLVDCRVIKESQYVPRPYEKGDVEVSDHPLEYLSKTGYFIDSSLNKVYRRDFIGHTRFDESISYSEDKLFVTELIFKAKKIALVSNIFYHYIQHGAACPGRIQRLSGRATSRSISRFTSECSMQALQGLSWKVPSGDMPVQSLRYCVMRLSIAKKMSIIKS